jgi:hypothetical protein
MPKTVGKRVRDYLPVLALLASKKLKPHVKSTILDCAALQEVLCLCALNILKGRVSLSAAHKRNLKKYKKTLIAISSKHCNRKRRRVYLSQKGGFLGALLAPLLTTLAPPIISTISGLFGK